MSLTGTLTSGDLNTLADLEEIENPQQVADQLVAAVDEGRLAAPELGAPALLLAASIMAPLGSLSVAVELAERAVALDDDEYVEAQLAGLLLADGREAEAMAILERLRSSFPADPDLAEEVTDMLVAAGRGELAEQWLHAALDTFPRDDQPDEFYFLAELRHELRHELDLPHDYYDQLADQNREFEPVLGDDEYAVFWHQPEYDALLARWPELADDLGGSWDEHRTLIEQELNGLANHGVPRISLVPGAAAEVFAVIGDGPLDGDKLDGYAEDLGDSPRRFPWPPERNAPCWCDSGEKYKKCCYLRGRTA